MTAELVREVRVAAMPTIIVSYRRSDSKWITGRIVDRLERDYGKGDVFVDIDAIPLGMDFRDHLRNVLDQCDVLLAIVGPNWLATDDTGGSRIFEPSDWVRIEIETALAKGIPVIPVLIDRSPMPKVSDLPESLQAFAFRQAADVDTGRDFHVHMDRLARAISQAAAAKRRVVPVAEPAATVTASTGSLAPADQSFRPSASAQRQEGVRWRRVIAAVVAAACVATVVVMLSHVAPERPVVITTAPTDAVPPSQAQVPPESPESPVQPETAAPTDPEVAPEPPMSLDPSSVPPDVPVPPNSIEQPLIQRASLFEVEKTDPNGRHFSGRITWRAEKVSTSPGQIPTLVARADIVIPERSLALRLLLRNNTDPNLPASHTIELRFSVPPDFAQGGVSNVSGVSMRPSQEARGVPLEGLPAKVAPGVFIMGLAGGNADRARNLQMLRDYGWFDIPMMYGDGTRALLVVEKGTDGERVFKQVLSASRP